MRMVDIKKSDGTSVNAELISIFEVVNIAKKYIFYTLNETVENNLITMYVAEVTELGNKSVSVGQKMTEEEWANLKGIMKSILTGSDASNIKYLEIEGV